MTTTYPPHLNRATDFCCNVRGYGCGHHIDGHGGFGSSCNVSGCDCPVWRDHVGCDHHAVQDETVIVSRTLKRAGRWAIEQVDAKLRSGEVTDFGYVQGVKQTAEDLIRWAQAGRTPW